MKERLLTGWNVQRIFYLIAGGGMVAISISDRQWAGMLIGVYFAAMGLFAFGCASGNCFGGACRTEEQPDAGSK